MKNIPVTYRRPCRGAVLLLAMIYMLMLAIITTTVLQTAILQLKMSGNDQFFEEAFHRALAIAAELALDPENFPLDAAIGHSNCAPDVQNPDCDQHLLQVPASALSTAGTKVDYRVTRQEPLLWRGFPIRESQDAVSSSRSFDAVVFEIDVRIDGSEQRVGSAHIVQGVAVRVATFP